MKKTLIATAVAMGITAVSFPAYAAGDNDITTTANEEEEDTGLSLTVIPRLDGSAQTWKNIEKPFGSYSLGNTMLYTILDGNVTDNLSVYACFHLLDKETGWLYHNTFHSDECSWLDMFSLTYSLGNFDLSLGKENIAFGGFEQDDDICTPHLDLCSNSWHTIQSFQWGGRLGYNFEDHGNPQNVFFQIVSSPTSEMPFQDKLFCTTIGWNGNVGNDETMWSLGVMRTGEEDASMKNLWMLTLGDRYTCGNFSWTWDLSFRSFAFSEIFRQECTNIMELR